MSYKIFSEDAEEKGCNVTVTLLMLENSVMVFFDEQGSMKLGTLAVAMPKLDGQTCISSILMGDRNIVITKILAERFSNAFNCISLISTHLANIRGGKAGSILLKLTQRLIDKTS